MSYLFISLAVLCIAIQFSIQKVYQRDSGTELFSLVLFNLLSSAPPLIIFFMANGFRITLTSYTVLMSAIISVVTFFSVILSINAVSFGKVSVYTIFMMLGGMMLPFIYGILFLGERPSVSQGVGMLLLIASMFVPMISRGEKTKNKKLFILLCTAVFFVNGLTSIISKLHQINPNSAGTNEFIIFKCLFTILLSLAVLAFLQMFRNKQKTNFVLDKKKLLISAVIIFAFSVISNLGYFLQLLGAKSLPAIILFPMITGGAIVVSSIAGRVFFGEKITGNILAGILITIVGTVLFLF